MKDSLHIGTIHADSEGAPVTDTMPEPSEMEPNGDGESNVDGALNGGYLAVGMALAAIGVILAFWKYGRKDIS